jgi:tRNA A-37 threonylcarbamoyl transferase component Bud32
MSPQEFGRYEIVKRLGKGGMATVYHAVDPHFERDVAVKVMPREFLHDDTFRERFKLEAKTIASLDHPAITPVFDYGEHEGQPFLVMRYMSGGSLSERLKQGPLPTDETVRIFDRLCEALDWAHDQGIIHRDIKPGNILFDQHGYAYLADFGIVKLTEATAHLTGSGIIGTPAYMAPEMTGSGGITALIDIYAMGVTLYQMLTGRLPYQADTPMGLALAHVTNPVPNILSVRPDLPASVQTIIERMMAKDPNDRCQRAGEMAAELAAALSGIEAQPSADTVEEAQPSFDEDVPVVGTAAPPDAYTMDVPSTALEREPVQEAPARARRRKRGLPGWLMIGAGVIGVGLVAAIVVGMLMLTGVIGGPDATPSLAAAGIETTKESTNSPTDLPTPLGVVEETPTLAAADTDIPPTDTPTATPGRVVINPNNVGQMALQATAEFPYRVWSLAWSPDDRTLMIGTTDTLQEIDPETGEAFRTLAEEMTEDIAWSADGTELAYTSLDDFVRLDVESGDVTSVVDVRYYGAVYTDNDYPNLIEWSSDGKYIVTGGSKYLTVFDAETGEVLDKINIIISSLDISPNSQRLALTEVYWLYIFEIPSLNKVHSIVQSDSAGSVTWSPDGSMIGLVVSSKDDDTIVLYDSAEGMRIHSIPVPPLDHVSVARWSSFAISPDNSLIAAISEERTILVFDVSSGEQLATLSGHTQDIYSMAWSHDGTMLATAGGYWEPDFGELFIWRIP